MSYRPHAAASRLGSGKTHTLGLLVQDFQEPYYVEITDAIIEAAKKPGYSLLVTTTQEDKLHLADFLRSGNIDGLIVVSPFYVEEELAIIREQVFLASFLTLLPTDRTFPRFIATNLL
ncbi:hypothetical protein CSA56_08000 [candidate division KSB3 bacterium]|uniref:Periplasmic binding protein/LacI sugar binding domain-containing protein n=1 Tax=candidate division KSB3 bacterium TaxID=2044937 RepID=A0A2G6KF63_9BACT|nr:MAG: hypothetical protein CSA56_08000 [candidate division KSB3 bacterium]